MEKIFESIHTAPDPYIAPETFNERVELLKECFTSDSDSIEDETMRTYMADIFKDGLASTSDLDEIVSDPRMNGLAGEAVYINLNEDMNTGYKQEYMVECLSGRPISLDTYRFVLDHQKASAGTECLKMINLVANAPFSSWVKEFSEGKFAKVIEELGKHAMSDMDVYYCEFALSYIDITMDNLENQGLSETSQYSSLATMQECLQGVFGENQH